MQKHRVYIDVALNVVQVAALDLELLSVNKGNKFPSLHGWNVKEQ